MSNISLEKLKLDILKKVWGFSDFRELQKEIIDNVLSGKDTVVLLPTGGGKSLCYQLPAIIAEGICLVVSPLLALMKDQVAQLRYKGIEAEYISSELSEEETENIYYNCREGFTKILYISPERLSSVHFLQNIETLPISFLAVDEAHCISEWGQDFRASYQKIKKFREESKKVPCIALTATATPKVLQEITLKLGLHKPNIFKKSFHRDNLQILTEECGDKYSYIADYLSYNRASGLIYTRTRKEAEELTKFLQNKGCKEVDFFHAGLSAKEKNAKQSRWMQSNSLVLISTNAFGMGIDKENVRFVIHSAPAPSVENYYQEIGRAGRDSNTSSAILLWNLSELKNLDHLLRNQFATKSEFLKIISVLYSIFGIADQELTDKTYQFHIEKLKRLTALSGAKINTVLNFLHNQEIIFYNTKKSLSSVELKIPFSEYENLPRKEAYFLELLLRNLDGFSTHKVYFSDQKLAAKLGTSVVHLQDSLREAQKKNYLDYLDGSEAQIKFLIPRNEQSFSGKWWNLFMDIHKNKIRKWEEMKYFIQENSVCKMKLINNYFGEKHAENCGNCNVCRNRNTAFFDRALDEEILTLLHSKPATLEEMFIKLNFHKKEKIRENLILMLDSGKVKMLDFRTYSAP